MNPLRKLAGQTAIYGLSSIIGRVISYLMIPVFTRVFAPEEYGVSNELYAYSSLLLVLLTYGMETAFFRFSEIENDRKLVYSTSLISILITTGLFAIISIIVAKPVAVLIRYPDHVEYIIWFALIVSMDALTAIPFARLRSANKAARFATIKLINIIFYVLLILFFLLLCPYLQQRGIMTDIIRQLRIKQIGVGYIFISNLLASALTIVLLLPDYIKIKLRFDFGLWKRMMPYALPLLIVGFAGIINETMDRIFLKFLLPPKIAMAQVGIYGACYKISLIMTIFIQAFRFAAEPFFFSLSKDTDAKQTYASVMKYFVIVCSFIFLGTMMYLDIIKYFVDARYYTGLSVVPILLLANMFLGVYFNLSIWYKLTGQTKWGAFISVGGAVMTIILNVALIPVMQFMGSAWATMICYFSMMVASYFLGQRYYKVPYDLLRIMSYLSFAVILYLIGHWIFPGYGPEHKNLRLLLNTGLLLLYIFIIGYTERSTIRRILKIKSR